MKDEYANKWRAAFASNGNSLKSELIADEEGHWSDVSLKNRSN